MIDKELQLMTYTYVDAHQPEASQWIAESQTFKYLHPLDGKEETFRFHQRGATESEAHLKARKQLDWFNGDRGNCITEIIDFTEEELGKGFLWLNPQ